MTLSPDASQYYCVPCRTTGTTRRATNRRVVRSQPLANFINARHGQGIKAGSAYAVCEEHLSFLADEKLLHAQA